MAGESMISHRKHYLEKEIDSEEVMPMFEHKQIITEIKRYETELSGILARFEETPRSLGHQQGDDPRCRHPFRALRFV